LARWIKTIPLRGISIMISTVGVGERRLGKG